jgi:RimJ/RimL family protein N-acetyltransferase
MPASSTGRCSSRAREASSVAAASGRGAGHRQLELGFHLRPEHWGKGLATEAARAAIAFAFDRLRSEELFAGHHPANAASARTLRKLGFRYSHDELYPPTGLRHPSYVLAR